jgi:hypothetical protein
MTGVLFSVLLLVHALLHLVGVSRNRPGAKVGQTLPLRLLWLLAAALFLSAFICRMAHVPWWYTAAAGIFISQGVIASRWREAKAGTAINVAITIAVVLAAAQQHFRTEALKTAETILTTAVGRKQPVTPTQIAGLPPVVQLWLRRSGITDNVVSATVRLKQNGRMRLKPTGKWIPVSAEQYFRTDTPAFIWLARVGKSPIYFAGRDRYKDGHGHMTIKILSVIPVANATGYETDQGSMLRYLAEMQWFPAAALSPFVQWRQTAPDAAVATITYGGITDSGTYYFSPYGDVVSFEAMRYMNDNGRWHMRLWRVPVTKWATMNGVRVPVAGKTIWKMPEGDFNWFEWRISHIEYDCRNVYP